MVNKNLDLVDRLTFADVHESYPEEQKEEIYDEIFHEEGFAEPDLVVLTGGPNEGEEKQRRDTAIQYLNEFREEAEKVPRLLTTPSQRKDLLEDDRIDEADYIFHPMEPDSSLDEIESIRHELDEDSNVAVVTNDYHVPRYEKRLNAALSEDWKDTRESWGSTLNEFVLDPEYGEPTNDYIVLGAEFSEDENEYRGKWNSEAVRTALPQKLRILVKNTY